MRTANSSALIRRVDRGTARVPVHPSQGGTRLEVGGKCVWKATGFRETGPVSNVVMTGAQVVDIAEGLRMAGVRFWIFGGWGIDALVGEQTRPHHDLDLLVDAEDLPALDRWLQSNGFRRAFEWDESESLEVAASVWDTAFVCRHPDGRELDVHALQWDRDRFQLVTRDPWRLPDEPVSSGRIEGTVVPCVTVAAQLAMHRGYDLPEKHHADLQRIHVL